MKITVVGGGNIGTQFAVHCAEKKHDVVVYTSDPSIFSQHLRILDESGCAIHEGKIQIATNDPEVAFRNADLIMVTVPAMIMRNIADIIWRHTDRKPIIGAVPGNGGSECAFKKCIDRGNQFFSIERVPAIARLVKKGESVRSVGYRNELHLSALPVDGTDKCCELIESIYDIPCKKIPGILNLTMTPSNPILHTTRLKVLFNDWNSDVSYDSVPLFYEDWDDASSELLLACDGEVQGICRALPELHLDYVKSLRTHYNSYTVDAMTKKISSIEAFKGLETPTVNRNGRLVPDLHSRYFTADFSYGLAIIKQIADFADFETPNIDGVLKWYDNIAVVRDEFRYSDYGIIDKCSFELFYLR